VASSPGQLSAPPPAADLYERSLLVFDELVDRDTGAVIAAPECDADFEHSGGYGFVWPRDLAYLILAFLAAERRDLVVPALRWLVRAQEPCGLWLQRHHTDGSVAPSWCAHQLDETATAVFAYDVAWRNLQDAALDAELWPSARRAADALLLEITRGGLPAETTDLWEERDGVHAYTAAAFVGAFRAAEAFAKRHDPSRAERYGAAARNLAAALDRAFWSDEHGRYLRTLGDSTVDASLLGLAWPFHAVDPRGERMRATAAAVETVLARPRGGILRYAGDTYAGGNPWVLAALWLGLYKRMTGDAAGLERALAYARRVATDDGLLAEQVDDDGNPVWVLPLAWSHAMYVLAARPPLD
jgi:glucoamylase